MIRPPTTDELRDAIGRALQAAVKSYDLARVCSEVGIRPDENTGLVSNSKWATVLSWLTHDPVEVRTIAEHVVARYPSLNLEELLWRLQEDVPALTELTRRKIIAELAQLPDPWGALGVEAVLDSIFSVPGYAGNFDIQTVVARIDLLNISGRRFRMFLERLVEPRVREEAGQKSYVAALNPHLRRCGWELRVTGEEAGYPVYKTVLVSRGVEGQPKNIIFASCEKPDLRFADALNNDIEIMSDPNKVLIYDRPIPSSGLRWRELQLWWASREGVDPEARTTKESLYRRLYSSLPKSSPPQQLLFRTFYGNYKDTFDNLPCLLPEVWLHYDPKTIAQRGRDALLRQRMDFLMLFSHEVRVVIEVDGAQHYCDESGRGAPEKYAMMVAADRDLKLSGYDIFRFGGSELLGSGAEGRVADFFDDLFCRHGQ
jgi:hypothetical protein